MSDISSKSVSQLRESAAVWRAYAETPQLPSWLLSIYDRVDDLIDEVERLRMAEPHKSASDD